MKKFSFVVTVIILFVSSSVYAWDIMIEDGPRKDGSTVKGECAIIDINGKTKIKVCKCGSVAAQEWKEVVKNKDNTLEFYSGSTIGSIITRVFPEGNCVTFENGLWKEVPCR